MAIIQGIPGAGQSEGRTLGAKQVFESAPNVELVSIQPANWDRNTAYNIATNLLQAHPDLKGIFACNDVMALAAADASEAAGLGWLGKSGLFLTPADGPRVRLTTILTDAELVPGNTLDQQCGSCTVCIDACPAGAIKEMDGIAGYARPFALGDKNSNNNR